MFKLVSSLSKLKSIKKDRTEFLSLSYSQFVLLFAALFAVAAARPSYLAASPVFVASTVPVVRTAIAVPVVKTYATPLIHSYAPVYGGYVPFKKV